MKIINSKENRKRVILFQNYKYIIASVGFANVLNIQSQYENQPQNHLRVVTRYQNLHA